MSIIAVTGAAGVLGRQVLTAIAARGVEPIAIVRHAGATGERSADLSRPDEVAHALDGVDAVVHAASSPLGDLARETAYLDNVVTVARRTGAHVVYVSIVNVDRNRIYPYYRAKHDAELLLARSGVRYTIQRAAQFHPFLDYVFRLATRGPIAVLPPGAAFQPIDVAACANRLAELALGRPLGLTRDIAGPEVRSARDFFQTWKRARGVRATLVAAPLPTPVFRALAHRRTVNDAAEPLGTSFHTWLNANGYAPNPYVAKRRSER